MGKQQFNVGVPDITRRQVEEIAQRENMTLGEVVTMAVDRMYREMFKEEQPKV